MNDDLHRKATTAKKPRREGFHGQRAITVAKEILEAIDHQENEIRSLRERQIESKGTLVQHLIDSQMYDCFRVDMTKVRNL